MPIAPCAAAVGNRDNGRIIHRHELKQYSILVLNVASISSEAIKRSIAALATIIASSSPSINFFKRVSIFPLKSLNSSCLILIGIIWFKRCSRPYLLLGEEVMTVIFFGVL